MRVAGFMILNDTSFSPPALRDTTPACAPAASVHFFIGCLVIPTNEALALAEHLAHPFSLEVALLWNAILRLDRGEPTIALQRLEAAEMLASEQRLGFMWEPRFGYGQWDAELHRLEGVALLGLNR